MSTLSKKHLLFCSGLLAVLAGCGGGGSDTLSANNAQATPATQASHQVPKTLGHLQKIF